MSAASQAVGPPPAATRCPAPGGPSPTSAAACSAPALAGQTVAADDGVLAASAAADRHGPRLDLRRPGPQAFRPAYWQAAGLWADRPERHAGRAPAAVGGDSQAELNFSLFFGLAIDAYERTLVSDQSPFDKGRWARRAGRPRGVQGQGQVRRCHDGPLLSKAATFQGDPALDATARPWRWATAGPRPTTSASTTSGCGPRSRTSGSAAGPVRRPALVRRSGPAGRGSRSTARSRRRPCATWR